MSFFNQRLRSNERAQLVSEVLSSGTGCGTLYLGKYYHIWYEPTRDDADYKCNGVKLVIKRNPDHIGISHYGTRIESIPFKSGIVFNRDPYKVRLERVTSEFKRYINQFDRDIDNAELKRQRDIKDAKVWELSQKEDRELALEEHAKRILQCQIRIDNTMKKIEPTAHPNMEPTARNQDGVVEMHPAVIKTMSEIDMSTVELTPEPEKPFIPEYKSESY